MALQLDRDCAEAWNGIGRVEMSRNRIDSGIDAFTKAIDLEPDFAEAFIHRGVAFDRSGMSGAALMDLRRATELDRTITMADLLIYGILENHEQYAEAFAALNRGLWKRPEDPDLLFCRATLELAAGEFTSGWADYEYRPTKLQLSAMLDEYPEWDGSWLEDKRILVCREQGLGDEIMFARFLPQIANRGGHVIVYCYPALARLFERMDGVSEVVTTDADVPPFDCWVAMGSLPLKLEASLKAETYMTTAVDRVVSRGTMPRIGLCWQGNKAHARDAYRSIPFEALKPLLEIKDVEFVSLQQGDEVSGLERVGDRCHDLYDLGEAMLGLDLVITVDTSVVHLAGALGVPTWLVLGKPADWRWNTPLYESVTILRNEAPKKWAETIKTAKATLEASGIPKGQLRIVRGHEEISSCETRYGRMQYFTSDMWLGRSLAAYGEWSERECDLYRKVIGPDDVVVEVGANIGAHTVALAGLAKSVIAYEPSPDTFAVLRRNTGNYDNILCCCTAVGSTSGSGTMRTKVNNPGGTEVEFGAGNVPVITLDQDYGAEDIIAFLKLDCEGSELAVLEGAEETIARCRPLLYVENDRAEKSEALIGWIHEHGYRIYQHITPLFNPNNFRGYKTNLFGNIMSLMLFCVPKERYDMRPTEWGMERVRVTRS